MRTIKIIAIIFVTIFMVSCETYYRMVTTLDRDGNAIREVYTKGDSAFMAGDMSHNPFLFNIGLNWNIIRYDSVLKYNFFGSENIINVKASKKVSSIDLFSKELNCSEINRSLAAPEETLTKNFGWFYTNYTFTGVYKKLNFQVPVSIDKYLSKEEQKLWTQGNFKDYGTTNGFEMKNMLDGIEDEFMDWYSRNCFEIGLNSIEKISKKTIADEDKDKIYKLLYKKEQTEDIMPELIAKTLDIFYKTNSFSKLYKTNKKSIDQEFENTSLKIELLSNIISYELIVPGEIISTNSSIINSNTLTWKVDGIRILFDDYTLTTQYRVTNTWAFILSGLVLLVAITSIILIFRKSRKIF